MRTMNSIHETIRKFLDYQTFIYKAKTLKFADHNNFKLFIEQFKKKERETEEYKNRALYNSAMLLYAINVENLLKSNWFI